MLLELQAFARSHDPEAIHSAIAIAFKNRYIAPYDRLADAIDELLNAPKISCTRLKEQGWTDSLIRKHLPEPSLHPNPYGYASQMRLWLISDVAQAETEIRETILKNREKRANAKSVCDTAKAA